MTETPTSEPDQALRQAVSDHQAGRLDEAERCYRQILAATPGHPEANHNLGVLVLQRGLIEVALPHLKRALEADPAQGQYWFSYVESLMQAGRASVARQVLEQGRQRGLGGAAFDALAGQLGVPMREASQPGEPTTGEVRKITALFNEKRYAELETAARQLAERYPDNGFGWKVLGVALKQLGRVDEAVAPMRRAAALLHGDAEAHNNLGVALKLLARLAEAEGCFRRVLEIDPQRADTCFNLGDVLREQGRIAEAEPCYRSAAVLNPASADAHANLGSSLHLLGRLPEAEASFRRALALAPKRAEVVGNLGNTLRDQGRLKEAEASFRRALELAPQALEHAVHAHLMLSPLPSSSQAITEERRRFEAGISALEQRPLAGGLTDPGAKLHATTFYLAYHNRADRPVMEAVRAMFRARMPGLTYTAPHVPSWRTPARRGARLRLGVLSEYLETHTIGKLYQGLVAQMDRRQFEVVVIHALGGKEGDGLRQAIDRAADRSVTLPPGLAVQQQAVAGLELDALFYPDIGMSPTSYFLAYSRLAPVQAVSWGHPDTTGLDTLDYFVSAASIEPQGAEAHYTERLVRLGRLPCFYQPLVAPNRIPARAALGLPEGGTLYACPQSLFKLHPDFDAVLAEIARGDPAGHILLLESHVPLWTEQLRRRWARRFPELAERVCFLSRQPLDRFMALLAHIDVLLDPLHFGSGNTLYEGMVYGTPVVTWAGDFMRGRIVAGAYSQMGIADAPIAARIEDYAPLALALGRDPQRRLALRRASMAAAVPGLYTDRQFVREFESFLICAVEAAGRAEWLPRGWTPPPAARDER